MPGESASPQEFDDYFAARCDAVRRTAEVPDTRAGPDAAEQSAARPAFTATPGQLPPRQRAVLVCR